MVNVSQAVNSVNSLTTIDFYGQPLLAMVQDNTVYTALKNICENIGLDWTAQRQRIIRDEVLNSTIRMVQMVAEDGKNREMLCLPIHYLNGWLFGIDVSRVKSEIKDKLITYKKECYQALFDYWHKGVAVNPRKTTADDRTPLRQAVSMLVGKRGIDYSTAYTFVHQYMGVQSIDEIDLGDLPKAVAYVHSLILNDMLSDRVIASAQHLAWHTSFIYSWYKAIEKPFRSLSPKLSYQIHDHIVHAKICARDIERQIGFGMDKRALENKTWAVGFDGLS